MSRAGAVSGIVSGMACVLSWHLLNTNFDLKTGIFASVLPGFEMIPAFLISLLSIAWFSLKFPVQSAQMKKRHLEVECVIEAIDSQPEPMSMPPLKIKS